MLMYLANTDLYYCHPELDAHPQAPRIYYIFYIKLAYYQESAVQIHKRLKLPFIAWNLLHYPMIILSVQNRLFIIKN